MLDPRPNRLSPATFGSAVRRTPLMLVRVERAMGAPFLRGLPEYLDGRYPGKLSFGVIARGGVTDPSFWTQSFQSALGPLRHGVSDGYFLFESGLVVGFNAGQGSTLEGDARHSAADRERIRALLGRLRLSEGEVAALQPVAAYFDEVIDRRRRVVEGVPPPPPPEEPRGRAAPPPPPPPAAEDPYALLGLKPGASDEEIRDAWKNQMKLNHPDRVAHMSPALQQFAHAQTLAIQSAYDALMARRRR